MALNSSGAISLAGSTTGQSIALELSKGSTTQITLNDTDVRTLGGKASGAIAMPTDFWGKSSSADIGAVVWGSISTPRIIAYRWTTTGFGTQYSNPATLPASRGYGVRFSPDGTQVAVALSTTGLIAYPWSNSTGFGAKYSDPSGNPENPGDLNSGNDLSWSPEGNAIAIAYSTTPYVVAYRWSNSTGFGTQYSDPTSLPPSFCYGVAFSPDGNSIAVAHDTSPFISAYAWSSSTGFGAKYSNPSTLPGGQGQGVAFSPSSNAIAWCGGTDGSTSTVYAYAWNSGTGFGAKYSDPGTLPPFVNSRRVAFHPSGNSIAVTVYATSGAYVYAWSAASGFGSKYSDPSSLAGAEGYGVRFSKTGTVIGIALNSTNRYAVYPWSNSTGFGTRYTSPASPTSNSMWDVDFLGNF